jgi:ATP-dependent DNA helicase RecG
MAELIGISRKGVEWQMAKLKAEGLVRRIGPAKGGHWEVVDRP